VPDGEYRDLSADVAKAAGELLTLASPAESQAMHRLVELAARHVPGCSGAAAALWQAGEVTAAAVTHPDLAELVDAELRSGRGPVIDAITAGQQVGCADTLSDSPWPEYSALALALGVRCSLTLVHQSGPVSLTLTMFGGRPRTLDPERLPIGDLLIAFGGAAVRNTSTYGAAERAARQLSEGADSRAVVDQAKGILMASMSCTAAEALRRMREISQARQIRVTEVARRIVESHELGVR
jgi:hypothetical protein